jgi:hypothetical protein
LIEVNKLFIQNNKLLVVDYSVTRKNSHDL